VITTWQQHLRDLSLDYYDQAVNLELMYPHDKNHAFAEYYTSALLGCRDAAKHVSMAYEAGLGVEPSVWAARYWANRGNK